MEATARAAHEAEDKAYHEAYIRPYQEQEAARKVWEEESMKFCNAHINFAEQNADDTSVEEGFETHSKRWYECAVSTLHHARDNSDPIWDARDPQGGQSIRWGDDHRWVAALRWGDGWATHVTLIDREGNLEEVPIEALDSQS